MEKNLYEFESEPEKRSSFLTWLCILTFIGSGWSIISCIWSYTTAAKTSTMFSQKVEMKRDSALQKDTAAVAIDKKHSAFEGKIKASFSKILKEDNIRKTAIGGFIAALLTLTGALFMWHLKKEGFYIYILGVVFGILVPFYIFGNDLIAVGATSFANFFGLVFTALYALNLKSMNRKRVQEF
jgi:ABC-type Fe3+-siderophore transport system permease subunit